jgi:pimeloyl-ACP methyl ester carboxylesterase
LTSIMSTTGEPGVGMPLPEVVPVLLEPLPEGREAVLAHQLANSRAIAGPEHFDEERTRERQAAAYDRCYYPAGSRHQLLAIAASGSRVEALSQLDVPTLVIHGTLDPLIQPSGGERTAEVIPGAELLLLEGMGHSLAAFFWTPVIEAVTALAARSTPPL